MTVFVWDSDLKQVENLPDLEVGDEFIAERGVKPGRDAKKLQK